MDILQNQIKSDIIVCDFLTLAGIKCAQDLNIPFIINIPGSSGILKGLL